MVSTRAGIGGWSWPVAAAALLAAYLLAALWGYEFAVTPNAGLSVWYPPPGILLVVLHRRGLTYWPVAVLAELIVGWAIYDVGDAFGFGGLLLNAVLVTGAYLLGAIVLRAFDFDRRFTRRRDLAAFVIAAFLVAAPLAGLLGTAMTDWAGLLDSSFVRAWVAWWVGDAIGMLVMAPVVYLILDAELRDDARRLLARIDPLAVGQALAVVAIPAATFVVADDPYRFLYVPLLPVVLVAARRGAGPAAFAVVGGVVATTIAASRTEGGTVGRYELQLLLLVLAMTGHALGIVESLRRRSFVRQEELAALIDASPDVVAVVDAVGSVQWANPAARRVLNLRTTPGDDGGLGPLPGGLDDGAVAMALQRGSWRGSARVPSGDGDDVRLSQVLVALPDDQGERRVGVVARDVTDLHRVTDQLTRMAFVDPLTGLANRARFEERLAFALGTHGEPSSVHGVALIDIDRFGALNDRLGRGSGDDILRLVARRLREHVRTGELIVRMADDSFAVLLEDIPDTFSAVAVAERLRAAACGPLDGVSGVEAALQGTQEAIELTASAGVAVGETGEDPEIVLRRADLALQRAKQAGGGSTAPYDPALSERLERRIRIESTLRAALGAGGWGVRYQPVVDLETGEVVGCEALLEPVFPPLEVVDVAEELGLISALGAQVLATSIAEVVRWRRRLPELRISVNVSAKQLLDPAFPDLVDRTLRGAGLPARALVLEITETVFADDRIEAAIAATLLQGMGVRISVDDFGTGFSSLGRLRSLPVDELKLDRTFVADLGRQPGAEAIVTAVVSLGAARHLDVIAEGIEEETQRDVLRSVGCRYGQGWLYARPMPASAFDAWLDQHGAPPEAR